MAELKSTTPPNAAPDAPTAPSPPTPAGGGAWEPVVPSESVTVSAPPPSTPPGDKVLMTASQVRGLEWASNLGWGAAALGLLVAVYSLYRGHEDGTNYNPAGISGVNLGLALAVVGFLAGLVFIFVPPARPSRLTTMTEPGQWNQRAVAARTLWWMNRSLQWTGVGLVLLGLVLASYVLRDAVVAGSDAKNYTLAGRTMSYNEWAGAMIGISLVGVLLWAVFGVRAKATHDALQAYVAASRGIVVTAAPPSEAVAVPADGGSAPWTASPPLPAGVSPTELIALMKKVDGLLAALPDDTVSAFSKTPEADTYLKLLASAPDEEPAKPAETPPASS